MFALAVLGLQCCMGLSLAAEGGGYSPVVVCGLLVVAAFLAASFSSCSTWAWYLWLPGSRAQAQWSWHIGLVAQSCLTLCDPMNCSPLGSSVHGDSPGKNTGVGCHALFQGIFPTDGLNLGLLHCRWILLLSEPPQKPITCGDGYY